MTFPTTLIALAGLTLTFAAHTPASALPKQQGAAPRYTTLKRTPSRPTVPVEAATVREDAGDTGTDLAGRIQDGHHGDGHL